MTLLRGYYTADWAVLFELERSHTILETEYHCNGAPLPAKLEQARAEMRALIGGERPSQRATGEPSKGSQNAHSATISVMETAEKLGITPQSVRRRCVKGTLPAVMVNGSWRIQRASAEANRKVSV